MGFEIIFDMLEAQWTTINYFASRHNTKVFQKFGSTNQWEISCDRLLVFI